jgi:hypothetical protein
VGAGAWRVASDAVARVACLAWFEKWPAEAARHASLELDGLFSQHRSPHTALNTAPRAPMRSCCVLLMLDAWLDVDLWGGGPGGPVLSNSRSAVTSVSDWCVAARAGDDSYYYRGGVLSNTD